MKRTRQQSSSGPQSAPAPTEAPPDLQDGVGNAAMQTLVLDELVSDQLDEPPTARHRVDVLTAACLATNRMFENDPDGFQTEHLSLLDALDDMQSQFATMEARDAEIDATAREDSRYADVTARRADRARDYTQTFAGTWGLGGWLLPTHYGPEGETPLIGAYARPASAPEDGSGSAGIARWSTWSVAAGEALEDLMDRAGELLAWADSKADALAQAAALSPAFHGAAAVQLPAPAVLTDARGREFMYLLEVLKDRLDPAFVEAAYGRDRGELAIEQQALDLGVSVARIAELEGLIDQLSALEDLDVGMDTLSDLPPVEAGFVIRHLRWDTTDRDLLLGWVTENQSAYTDLSARLHDDDTSVMVQGAPDQATHQQQLRDVVAGTDLGGYATDGEGTQDRYGEDDMMWDMARGLPGATLHTLYGMGRAVPIAGDAMDLAIGDHVDRGIDRLNQDWMGMDARSSATQEILGQTNGMIAGSIGLAGIAGPMAAEAAVGKAAVTVPAWAARGLWGADLAYGGYQAATGENLKGEELADWQRVLAGLGVVVSGTAGASQIRQATPGSTSFIDDLAQKSAAAQVGPALRPGLGAEAMAEQAARAEALVRAAHVTAHTKKWEKIAKAATFAGLVPMSVRSSAEARLAFELLAEQFEDAGLSAEAEYYRDAAAVAEADE